MTLLMRVSAHCRAVSQAAGKSVGIIDEEMKHSQ